MPEFRQNLATKEWVILSPGRGLRPHDMERRVSHSEGSRPPYKADCPFCRGNEFMTTEPVWSARQDGGWQVRVVPNKYAALNRDLEPIRRVEGRFLAAEGFGVAEVVIEHPRHDLSMATMRPEEVALVLEAYRDRHAAIDRDRRINLVTIFRNHGPRAGTSLEHPHSQIIATPIVPPHVRDTLTLATSHYDKYGTCVYCDMLAEELAQAKRVVVDTDHFAAFCPFASRTPFECRIYPKRHMASYLLISDDEIRDLAMVLRTVLAALGRVLGDPDYNYVIRSAPSGDHDARYLHWYIVIIPKVSTPAGFEIGTGIYINTTAPELCAEELREQSARDPSRVSL